MKNTKTALKKGFSLVEMLVVIAVIGIIAAIAVPNIGKINDKAKEGKNLRNAQNVASIFASANAAGLDFFATGDSVADVVAKVVTGDVVPVDPSGSNPFEGNFFGSPGLGATDQTACLPYLNLASGNLIYIGK